MSKLQPIKEYVLLVDDPEHPRSTAFLTSSMPFPVPNVGDEIEVSADAAPSSRLRVVTRVRHVIQQTPDGIVCKLHVCTDWKHPHS
jgi:hypothetical protein